MTRPVLIQILTEPSKRADIPAKPRTTSSTYDKPQRRDDRDFASVMSDRNRDSRKDVRQTEKPQEARDRDRTTETRQTDKARSEARQASERTDRDTPDATVEAAEVAPDRSTDDIAPELAQGDTPRRQVTIPELPARRIAVAEPNAGKGASDGTTPVAAKTPVLEAEVAADDALSTKADTPTLASTSRAAETGAPVNPDKSSGLARTDGMLTIVRSDATVPSGADMTPTAKDADARQPLELPAEPGRDIPRRHGEMTAAETRAPAQAMSSAEVAQSAQLRKTAQESVQAAAEDRADRHSREPSTRAVEAVAAAATTAPTPQATATVSSASAQLAALQPAAKDAIAAKEKADTAFALEGDAESLRFDMRGTSGTHGTQQSSFASAVGGGTMARHVSMQIAEFVRNMPDRPIDVSLSPEELGRVRLSISTSEGGVTLHVLAERPETLDLMRKHADQLARELADLGFSSIDLAFGQGRDTGGEAGDGNGSASNGGNVTTIDETGAVIAEEQPVNRLTLNESGGLDIRI